jgi:putative transposase
MVFASKCCRQVFYWKLKADMGKILHRLCERKELEIIEVEYYSDHNHMFVRILPKYSVWEAIGYLKGKSLPMIFNRYINLECKYGNR